MTLKAKLKAHLMAPDAINKLALMKKELVNGNAGAGDLRFWERYLSELKEYADANPKHLSAYQRYEGYRKVLEGTLLADRVTNKAVPLLIIASVHGDFTLLREHIAELKQDGDTVVVMGDFMKNPHDETSIQEAMQLAGKGVIFLKGKNEESYQEAHEGDDTLENLFIRRLPEELVTADMIVTTANTKKNVVDMDGLLFNPNFPNLTDKFIIGAYTNQKDKDLHVVSEKKKVLGLPERFGTRLYFGNP